MNATILAGIPKSERARLHLPPSILKKIEDEERDCSWYRPDAIRVDAWWLYVAANHRAKVNAETCEDLKRRLGRSTAAEARLQAEVEALRDKLLNRSATEGVK